MFCANGDFIAYVDQNHDVPAVYLASPGRLKMMQPILSREAMEKLDYPHYAYEDLVRLLGLPSCGYDFTGLKLGKASSLSQLTMAVADKSSEEALAYTLNLRSQKGAVEARRLWAERIWNSTESVAIGSLHPGPSTIISDSTVIGDVTQIIYAQARN